MAPTQVEKFWDVRWKDGQMVHPKHRGALELLDTAGDAGKRIVDFGCGPGVFLDLLRQAGFDPNLISGVDISEDACRTCQAKGLRAAHGDIFEFDGQADVAVLIDVLEHIFDPDGFFSRLREIAPEAVIVAPNFSSYKQRVEMLAGRVPFQNKVNRGGHVFFINHDVAREYFRKHGFEVVRERHTYSKAGAGPLGRVGAAIQGLRPNLFAVSLGYRLHRI